MILPGAAAGRTPPVALPLAYLGVATAAFVVAATAVPWLAVELSGHYYHPRLLALAHTVALGWVTLTIMGASYQLIPIVLERPLWSERLARWQLLLLTLGIAGMVGHFWLGHWSGLAWAAGLVAIGAATHVVNVGLSLRGLDRWGSTTRLFALALAGLALTVLFGLTLAAARVWGPFGRDPLTTLTAHVQLALLGWVAPMILGVATRVYPMFLLAREPGERWGRLQVGALAVGTAAVVAGLLVWAPLVGPGAAAVAAALLAHGISVGRMVRARRRPTWDWALRFLVTGTAFLVPALAMGLALAVGAVAGPRPALTLAVLALGGWVSFTIVGMMLKIVPFLVWYRVFGPRVGREPVPTLAQLGCPGLEGAAFLLLTCGVSALAATVGVGRPGPVALAGSAVAVGAVLFAASLGRAFARLLSVTPISRATGALGAPPR